MNNIYDMEKEKNLLVLGEPGKGTNYRQSDGISKELMQAISIAQTVIKPIKQHDYCIEYATKLLAGSILYLNQRHKSLYYLDVKKAIEFTEKLYKSDANLVEVVDSLKKEHPAYHIFHELGFYSEETRDTIIVTLLYNLEKYQREKLNPEREYFWFQ
ncbi:TRAG family protein [Bacillus thuringiensis]|nr:MULTISPECIES: TRAG family protein [Bacillus cereus group]MED3526221.1 TRAG family protein [Bacillus thuringiensis]PEB57033.1 TRAG family protein [Bacillus cereus]PEB85924.1 TRAG family protein [Bacillus thuringiensis]PEE97446.1 TRAG family protein [Bacillus thuringiensis]PEV04526.1 TRAG family protein [Bacillus thuringiensis]